MSIHGSKGLEFPFVFLANTTRKFVSDSNDNVLIHKDLGFSLKAKDYENSIRYNTLPKVATSIEIKNSEKSEELRVLYVALTRAREELHMICTDKNMANYINKMGAYISNTEKISPYAVSSANKISDWLIMCGLIQTDGSELRKIADINHFSKFKTCPKWDIKYIKGVNSEEKVQEECDTTTTQDTEVTDFSCSNQPEHPLQRKCCQMKADVPVLLGSLGYLFCPTDDSRLRADHRSGD